MAKNFWDKDLGWDRLYTNFEAVPGESAVFIGLFRSSGLYKPKEQGQKAAPMTVAQIGAIHEFGSKDGKIPERSFMRSAIDSNQDKLTDMIGKLTTKIADDKMTPKKALGLIGQFVRDKMIGKFNSSGPGLRGAWQKNADSTIARKGSSKPLIDTGQLKGAIDWEIHLGDKVIGSKG